MHRHQKHFPHNQTIGAFVESFRHTKLSGALTALYANRIIQQIGGGLVGLFFPILLYLKFDFSFYKVALYYLLSWSIWFFIIPLGAMTMSKIGLKKAMIFSVCFGWSWYFFVRQFEISGVLIFLVIAMIAVNLDRFFYWVPYHTDFAEFTDRRTRGKQMAFLTASASVTSIFIPFVSGFIIGRYGFDVLFILALIIYLMSMIPLFLLPEVREKFSFGYFQSYAELFKKKNRRMLLSYGADGMQNVVGLMVWPIFIWLILDQKYETVGIVSSVIIFGSLIIQLIMGNFADRFDKHRVLKWGTILNSIGWLIKMFVGTGFQIFVASTYHSFATIVMRTPFDALMYEKAADSGHYVDEYTVVRELALTLGRMIMLGLIVLIFFLTGSFAGSFLLAAFAALLIGIL